MKGWTAVGLLLICFAGTLPAVAQRAGPVYVSLGPAIPFQNDMDRVPLGPRPDRVGRLLLGGAVGAGPVLAGARLAYQLEGGGRLCGDVIPVIQIPASVMMERASTNERGQQ